MLPAVAVAPAAVYSIKKLITAYNGFAMTVTVSGSARNLGFSGTDLDVSGLSEGKYTITAWYDQSGNGHHLTAGSSSVPMLYVRAGHSPCIVFLENDYLNLPSSLAVDRANSAVLHAARYMWQNRPVDCINWGSGTTNMHFGSFIDGGHTPAMQIIANGATHYPSSTKLLSTCTPCVVGYNSKSSGLIIRRDGYNETLSAVPSGTFAGGRIGASGNPYTYARQDMFALVIYAQALSTNDELIAATAMRTAHNLNAWTPTKHIIMIGDSKTQGDAAVNNINLPRVLHDLYGNDPGVWIRNLGNNGSDVVNRYRTFWFTNSTPYIYVEPATSKNAVVCWLGINDIGGGRTSTQILSDFSGLFNVPTGSGQSLTVQGWRGKVLSTIMPARTLNVVQEATRVAVNAAILTVPNVTTIWDVNGLCNPGGVLAGFTSDTSLSQDGVHESEKAYKLEGASLKAAVEASLV